MTALVGLWHFGAVEATVYSGNRLSTFIGLSSDTKPSNLSGAGQTFYEADTSLFYVWSGTAWGVQSISVVGDSTGASLAAPGVTAAIYLKGYDIAGFYFEITNINTSVTIGLQSKAGTSGWTDHDIEPTTYTGDDNEGLVSSNIAGMDSLRLNFSAEAGGTDAIITNIVPTRGGQ